MITSHRPVIGLDVVPGVHRITHAFTNCYLLADDDGVTVVDAAFPSTWAAVVQTLRQIDRSLADVAAVVLTHGHFDHVGFARRAQQELGIPVWVHAADRDLAAHPYRYRPERNRGLWPLTHPGGIPVLGAMLLAGAARVVGVAADQTLSDGAGLPLPGRARVVHVPGHTAGQCALHLPDRSVLLSGDALVTLDPYTGATGPRLVAPAATADTAQAAASLQALATLEAQVVLPGHGEPYREGIAAAVVAAQRSSDTTR